MPDSRKTRVQLALGLLGWLLLSYAAAAIGATASVQASDFYQALAQPAWAPPSWLFGPVWTLLYALMGIAAWLVWRQGGWRRAGIALTLFILQLIVNALWSWLFFSWHLGLPAFVDIVILWVLLVATMASFWRVRPLAAALLLPYLCWISFAAALNFAVWQLNPQILG